MLQLKKIETDGGLRELTLAFRACELVYITGGADSGREELLSLLAGQKQPGNGEMLLSGVSWEKYREADWDAYRCHTVGLVCPDDLLAGQTVLANVEMPMVLSGVAQTPRRRRAAELLRQLGVTELAHRYPGELTPAQQRRASLARAMMNDPDILLLDEPTAGMDAAAAGEFTALLRRLAQDRLVIVFTDDRLEAEVAGGRVIAMRNGRVSTDSVPYEPRGAQHPLRRGKRPALRGLTALRLALGRRPVRRLRGVLTVLATALGAAALTLAFAFFRGTGDYLGRLEQTVLAESPLVVSAQRSDYPALAAALESAADGGGSSAVYARAVLDTLRQSLSGTGSDDLTALRDYLQASVPGAISELRCRHDSQPEIYASDTSAQLLRVNPSAILDSVLGVDHGVQVWAELPSDTTLLQQCYQVVAGRWPAKESEVVLVLDEDNAISDVYLCALGLLDPNALPEEGKSWHYEELMAVTFRLLLPTDYYRQGLDGLWAWIGGDKDLMKYAVDNALQLHVVGILRPSEENLSYTIPGAVGYTAQLRDYIRTQVARSAVVTAQRENPERDVFTGLPFGESGRVDLTTVEKADAFKTYALGLSVTEQTLLYMRLTGVTDMESAQAQQAAAMSADGSITEVLRRYLESRSSEEAAALYDGQFNTLTAPTTLEENLRLLGVTGEEKITALELYASSLSGRQQLLEALETYNRSVCESGRADAVVSCEDTAGAALHAVSGAMKTLGLLRYLLLAVSVLLAGVGFVLLGFHGALAGRERRRDCAVLHALGAPRVQVRRLVRTAAVAPGLLGAVLGVGLACFCREAVELVCTRAFGVSGVTALLSWEAGVMLVLCILLTLLAGFACDSAGENGNREAGR